MRPPRDMDIIEIELTNACVHRCSNCTRFCGHHAKPFFMSFETFKRAVDSMQGFCGTLSLMGGEPTLHPEFERFARYLHEQLPEEKRKKNNPLIYPQRDFMRAIGVQNICNMQHFPTSTGGSKTCVDGAGTFSSMGVSYMKNYEVIQDTLKFEGLNDHSNAMYHQPILISRKEMGISDEAWREIRDNCWINMQWSASITPKGAFFCEIAGALDMLFDGPGGLPIEQGWWQRDIEEFGEQLQWCEICGMALQTYSRDANEERDDISPRLHSMLKEAGSKKIGTGHLNIIRITEGKIAPESRKTAVGYRRDFYSSSYSSRYTATSSAIFPKGFDIYHLAAGEHMGRVLYKALEKSMEGHYVVLCNGNRNFTEEDQQLWGQYVINPGTLHWAEDESGFVALLHKDALSLRQMGMDGVLACWNMQDLVSRWIPGKAVDFDNALSYELKGLTVEKGVRLIQYGAGNNGEVLLRELLTQSADVVAVVDSDVGKQGQDFCGFHIQSPAILHERNCDYDKVLIASTDYYDEIRADLLREGISEEKIYDNETLWS